MDHPAAAHRLALGVPATVEHARAGAPSQSAASGASAYAVATTTQHFITLMDALKLKMRAKDQLHPLLSDLLGEYTQVEGDAVYLRQKLLDWCVMCLTQAHIAESSRRERRSGRRAGARGAWGR